MFPLNLWQTLKRARRRTAYLTNGLLASIVALGTVAA